jgi:predicted pyridoxine 5'-phosphate oxidase superfamily flavin-nucleotide-binding protein
MLRLTEEMKSLLKDNLCYVATASPGGTPSVAPKSCRFTGDGELYFIEWAGKRTYANILANPMVAVTTCSPDRKVSYRFEGPAKVLTEGPLYDSEDKRRKEAGKRPVVAIVMVDVTAVYDMGKKNPGGKVKL